MEFDGSSIYFDRIEGIDMIKERDVLSSVNECNGL